MAVALSRASVFTHPEDDKTVEFRLLCYDDKLSSAQQDHTYIVVRQTPQNDMKLEELPSCQVT